MNPSTAGMLAYRRAVARLMPAFGRSRCMHCWMPWGEGSRAPRSVYYSPGRGVFVTCRWCWPNTTGAERMTYAAALVFGVWPRGGVAIEDCHRDWPAIRRAFEEVG